MRYPRVFYSPGVGPACGGPIGPSHDGITSPGSSTLPGVLATVAGATDAGAFVALRTVPAGKTLTVSEVVMRVHTGNNSAVEGSFGTSGAGAASWTAFAPQSGLTAAGKESHIYPSGVGDTATFAAASVFGVTITTPSGVAGSKLTFEVIGREVTA